MFSSFASLARARIFISFSSDRFIWSGSAARLERRRANEEDFLGAAWTVGEETGPVHESRSLPHFGGRRRSGPCSTSDPGGAMSAAIVLLVAAVAAAPGAETESA